MKMLFFENKHKLSLVKRVYAHRTLWEKDLESRIETLFWNKGALLEDYENLFKYWAIKNTNTKMTIKKVPKCMYVGDPKVYEWRLNIKYGRRLVVSISEPFKDKKNEKMSKLR
jgi:hypothetical protein